MVLVGLASGLGASTNNVMPCLISVVSNNMYPRIKDLFKDIYTIWASEDVSNMTPRGSQDKYVIFQMNTQELLVAVDNKTLVMQIRTQDVQSSELASRENKPATLSGGKTEHLFLELSFVTTCSATAASKHKSVSCEQALLLQLKQKMLLWGSPPSLCQSSGSFKRAV